MKRGKEGKKELKQGLGIIDLEIENEDKERVNSMLLQGKNAEIKDLKRSLGMVQYIIDY